MRNWRGWYSTSTSIRVASEWRSALTSASRPIKYSCSWMYGFKALDLPVTKTLARRLPGVSSSRRLQSDSSSVGGAALDAWPLALLRDAVVDESGGTSSVGSESCMKAPRKPCAARRNHL